MLTAMSMSSAELDKGLILRGKAQMDGYSVVVEVVKTDPGQYWLVTGAKPGICWDFENAENSDCWDFEEVIGKTVGALIEQIESLLRYYRAEDGYES